MNLIIIISLIALGVQVIEIIKDDYTNYTNKYLKYAWIVLKCLAALGLAYITVDSIIDQRKQGLVNATQGDFGKQKDAIKGKTTLLLGSNEFVYFEHHESSGSHPNQLLDVSAKANQLMVAVYIRDTKGDLFASIEDRHWEITNTTGIDYNNDDSAFEIVTLDHKVIFQIQLKKDTILSSGIFCSDKGTCYYISNTNGSMDFEKVDENASQRFTLSESYESAPLFRYPRYKYLGIRDNAENEKLYP